jgi:hypothetical protein
MKARGGMTKTIQISFFPPLLAIPFDSRRVEAHQCMLTKERVLGFCLSVIVSFGSLAAGKAHGISH